MPDYGTRITDEAVVKALRKIRRVYAQAERELNVKMLTFRKRFATKQKQMLSDLEEGKISKPYYESWLRGQVFTGERWKKKINVAVNIFLTANRVAKRVIERLQRHVFSENYNRQAYETEIKTGVSFDIYNEDAVDKLLVEDPKLLPEWRIDEEKDYTWNREKLENAITQGIIQGESVDQIADRLSSELKSTNYNKMRMFARTAMTGAQNAGRQKQMEDAVAKGIKIEKQWISTLDDRTRDTHQHLDGQTVPVDSLFHVGRYSIRYPGDPNADPAMVYNCRCTMKSVFKGVNDKFSQRRAYKWVDGHRESYVIPGMTYDEWKRWKEKQ